MKYEIIYLLFSISDVDGVVVELGSVKLAMSLISSDLN